MKRFFVLMVGLMLLAGMAFAAEKPESYVDVFGGYQYLRTQGSNVNGWNAALATNATKNLGFVADFSGSYKNGTHVHTFLFGPQVSASFKQAKQVKPFVHVLFGADRLTAPALGGTLSDTSWAMALGGGVDVNVHKYVSVRLGQADWLRSNNFSNGQNNFRYSAGVVFHLGK